ncbi:hypothetical protein [Streptomyces viridochromogenes]|uniref:hypothetical protein n=1 Tax=Streptomyces viridochromogenes TaxID=1938 RepID=UPI00131A3BF2|nr:hypothetical protein [Streptomyces viridochromogenes]
MAAGVAGLAALIGKAGIGVGALLIVLIGNPFSGAASAPELLPAPMGLIGQWLPPASPAVADGRRTAFHEGR